MTDPNSSTARGPLARNKSAEPLPGELNSETQHAEDISPDDVPNIDAMREAARLRNDSFIVKTDLEDQDERDAAPGTREQP